MLYTLATSNTFDAVDADNWQVLHRIIGFLPSNFIVDVTVAVVTKVFSDFGGSNSVVSSVVSFLFTTKLTIAEKYQQPGFIRLARLFKHFGSENQLHIMVLSRLGFKAMDSLHDSFLFGHLLCNFTNWLAYVSSQFEG